MGILYGLKAIKETSVAFLFFMASLAFIRKELKHVFTPEELDLLDSYPEDDDFEEEVLGPAPDLENFEKDAASQAAKGRTTEFFERI